MINYIVYLVFAILMLLTLKQAFKQIKQDGYSYFGFFKEIYAKSIVSYFQAFALMTLILIIGITIVVNMDSMPSFFKWGWLSLLNEQPTNLITKPITESSQTGVFQPLVLLIIWVMAIFIMPILAYNEEVIFRSYNLTLKSTIKSSFVFSLVHIIMGIPVYALFILFIMGLLFSLIYVKEYKKHALNIETMLKDVTHANKMATICAGRVHAIYNILIISLIILSACL